MTDSARDRAIEAEHVIAAGARALFDLTRAAQLSPNPDRLWERMCADGDRPYFDQAEAVLRAAWSSGEAGAADTPPADVPAVWWSPSVAAASKGAHPYAGMLWKYVSGQGFITPDELPADAVRLVPAAAPTPTDDAWSAVETVARELEILARPDTVHGKWILGKLATNLRAVLARRTEETP